MGREPENEHDVSSYAWLTPERAPPHSSLCSVAQLCPTFCNSMDCSLLVSTVRGIFQERILEWVAISFSRASSRLRDHVWISRIEGGNRQKRLHLQSRTPSWTRLWTLSSMPSIYGNDIPTGTPDTLSPWESPRAHTETLLKEYPNYLCNWIESQILLCLLGYDHRPIDNCPLLTT